MPLEKNFNLNNIHNRYPIWQGGMGIGVSLTELITLGNRGPEIYEVISVKDLMGIRHLI